MDKDAFIFCDVDGVLNSMRSHIGIEGASSPVGDPNFDPVAVGILKRICKKMKCRGYDPAIVWSSTWRRGKRPGDFREMLQMYNWEHPPVVDNTPVIKEPGAHDVRAREIMRWLNSKAPEAKNFGRYVILDDDIGAGVGHAEHFVHVDREIGLSVMQLEQVLELFPSAE